MTLLGLGLGRPAVQSRMTYREYEQVLKVVAACAWTWDAEPRDAFEEMLDRWTETQEKGEP